MLAPSATHFAPLAISVFASCSSSSFCVAQGSADVHRHLPGPRAGEELDALDAPGVVGDAAVGVVLHLHQLGQLLRREARRSTTVPLESDTVTTFAPSAIAFSTAYCATLPEPETLTRRPSNDRPFCLSISSAK